MARRERFKLGAVKFWRSIVVGAAATALDFAVLEVCVRLLSVEASRAKIFAFLAGASVQFLGNRTYTFQAQGGHPGRQAALFVAAESVTLTLHYVLFRTFVRRWHMPIELANAVVSVLVYAGFSYPIWRVVFRAPPASAGASSPPDERG